MELQSRFFKLPTQSFFLFGPRGTGKSTWLRHELPGALFVDLLRSEVYREMSARPERLRDLALGAPESDPVVVDEVQRVPELLNVVHCRCVEREQRRARVPNRAENGGGLCGCLRGLRGDGVAFVNFHSTRAGPKPRRASGAPSTVHQRP